MKPQESSEDFVGGGVTASDSGSVTTVLSNSGLSWKTKIRLAFMQILTIHQTLLTFSNKPLASISDPKVPLKSTPNSSNKLIS